MIFKIEKSDTQIDLIMKVFTGSISEKH